MEWYEIKVSTSSQAIEMVSSILIEAGSSGVSIIDPLDLQMQGDNFGQIKPEIEQLYDCQDVFVSGYFSNVKNIESIKQLVYNQLQEAIAYGLDLGKNELSVERINEDDWANAWKVHYKPVRLSRFITIVPSWENYQPTPKEIVVKLDPGTAFGTGTHPTTRLSIEALELVLRGNEYVIDVGTGSGILSIVSQKLGASKVEAYDLDERATQIAKENIALNDLSNAIVVKENNLLVNIQTQADVIVANILAEILERLVEDAFSNLKEGGYFILSGIIQTKRDDLVNQLERVGFDIVQENRIKDWVSLICQKKNH